MYFEKTASKAKPLTITIAASISLLFATLPRSRSLARLREVASSVLSAEQKHPPKIFQNHLYFLKFSSSYIARVQKTDKIILNTVRMVLLWQEWQCHEYLTLALYFTIYKSMGFLKYLLSWTSYQLPDTRVITSPINESMS